jgi:hypothetical protein
VLTYFIFEKKKIRVLSLPYSSCWPIQIVLIYFTFKKKKKSNLISFGLVSSFAIRLRFVGWEIAIATLNPFVSILINSLLPLSY